MNLSRMTSGHIDDHFDRVLDRHLDESHAPVMKIEWCKSGVARDVDTNKFVSMRYAEVHEHEHSEACPCLACNETSQENESA